MNSSVCLEKDKTQVSFRFHFLFDFNARNMSNRFLSFWSRGGIDWNAHFLLKKYENLPVWNMMGNRIQILLKTPTMSDDATIWLLNIIEIFYFQTLQTKLQGYSLRILKGWYTIMNLSLSQSVWYLKKKDTFLLLTALNFRWVQFEVESVEN